MKVAIMQPYFFPYAGYFRLFSMADLFVVYDCVQFPRTGWVHRNRVCFDSNLKWVTLPIKKSPQETKICDLVFREDKDIWFESLKGNLQLIKNDNAELNHFDWNILHPKGTVVNYLVNTMTWCCEVLNISPKIILSSSLNIDTGLTSQDRIVQICRSVGAKQYINLPGGVSLYESEVFKSAGIDLAFLPSYEGGFESILGRLLKEPSSVIRSEVV